jgi:hypothetical protein
MNIAPLTLQQVFDNAVATAKTGEMSVGGPSCKYKAVSGCKCFIGASIPDSLYMIDFEGKSADGLIMNFKSMALLFGSIDCLLLIELQQIHDRTPIKSYGILDIPVIHEKLKNFAVENNLSFDWVL